MCLAAQLVMHLMKDSAKCIFSVLISILDDVYEQRLDNATVQT
jgi:hypothetical protein